MSESESKHNAGPIGTNSVSPTVFLSLLAAQHGVDSSTTSPARGSPQHNLSFRLDEAGGAAVTLDNSSSPVTMRNGNTSSQQDPAGYKSSPSHGSCCYTMPGLQILIVTATSPVTMSGSWLVLEQWC